MEQEARSKTEEKELRIRENKVRSKEQRAWKTKNKEKGA